MHARGSRGHRPGSSMAGSASQKQALSSAYASLANELTRKELRSIGGYSLGRTIGQGAFGTVKLGVHRLTNTRVAIKVVPKSLQSASADPSSPLSLLTRELHHHRRLRHQHILALYEIIATESSIYLVTELCSGGELFDYLVERGRLSLSETRRIFGQLVLGVAHLHQSGVVHRDLKLENILLDERVNVKIADLGFGREFEKGRWMETWVGTLGYCAPEVVAAKRYLGEEVDIWSLGVILYTLLTGSLPFDDDDEAVMKELILKCQYDIPSWLDEDAADLIKSILVLDPLVRLPLRSILAHPFFTRPPADEHHSGHQAFPPVIPEEGSMSDSPSADHTTFLNSTSSSNTLLPPPVPLVGNPSHSLTASDISDASYFSAMGSDPGPSSAPPAPSRDAAGSDVSKGKQKAADQAAAEEMMLLHPNEDGADDGVSSASDSTPRNGSARGRSTVPARTDEEGALPHSPSLVPISSLGLTAPPLQRNMSNSAGGSPVPHTRTPSRTKRRSVGSTFSERLFSLDEEHSSANVDYLALLSTPAPAPLSTPLEQSLLDSLTTLGFDTGQIVHSITTDACDASGAVWWMLKRKADERERERKEAEADAEAAQHQSPTVSRQSSTRRPSPNEPLQPLQETPEKPSTPPAEERRTRRPSAEEHLSPPGQQRELPVTPTAEERLQYFLHNQPLSPTAGPLLEYFPAAQNSPSRKSALPASRSREQLASGDSPESQHSSLANGSPELADAKAKRGRAGSVSMLARATSAIGTSLALKKPVDGAEENKEDGRASPARGGIFHRKSSVPDIDPPRRASVPNDDYPRSTPPASPEKARTISIDSPTPVTPIRAPIPLVAAVAVERQGSPSMSASGSTKTFDTITSSSSRRVSGSNPPAKKGNKLLSNLKMWFVTDHRKRPTTKTARSPSFGNDAAPPRSLSRSGSLNSRQARGDGHYSASPLARPPLGSRRSSNGSIAPLSRHSSMNSNVGRPKMSDLSSPLGHHRRRSDASRKSDSDREHSRPPSIRSFSADGTTRRAHHRHSKAASASSAGSFLPNSSPKDAVGTYRRPPTSTTVRRRHGSTTGRGSHSRQRSTSSSIVTRNSSSSSAGEEEVLLDEAGGAKGSAPILEEDETGDGSPVGLMSDIVEQKEWEAGAPVAPEEKAAAREHALRSLSGDYSTRPPHKSSSRLSLNSTTTASSSRSHGPVLFTAHKEHHIFGTPSQPTPLALYSHSRKDLDSFGGGLGQGNAASTLGGGGGAAGADSKMPDSPVAAGMGGQGHVQGQQGSGLFETGRRAFRAPVMTVEEEEEEEEE
ncbi:hypothetical protein BCR35DRAFT_305889 [Leucosporidium creatinivorum]|uniref:Protein kinase domain-containing protein n=1 Tax=Leucosporidium creatinivorum TaxID=106004 RepID=A0A1Y2EXC7_9BASI|nr:hypothetical protein BCR35DRAFT_305889 [Leucosporidium creatinivorum]